MALLSSNCSLKKPLKDSSYHSSLVCFTWSHWNNSSYHSSHFYFTLFHNNSVKNLKLENFHFKFIRNSKLLVRKEVQNYNSTVWILFLLGFTPCKVEQPLWDMKLWEKEAQKDWSIHKICLDFNKFIFDHLCWGKEWNSSKLISNEWWLTCDAQHRTCDTLTHNQHLRGIHPPWD